MLVTEGRQSSEQPCGGIVGKIARQPAKSLHRILRIVSGVGDQIESNLIGSGLTGSLVSYSIA
jgi:hypothetical protein